MRPIDADEFMQRALGTKCFHNDYALMLTQLVSESTTISPDEVRGVGEWIDKPTGKYGQWQSWCSACGNKSGIGGIKSNRHKPYCPNCGAKMKGVSEDA